MIQSNVIFPYSYTTQHAAVSNYCNLVSELLPILIQFENYYYRAKQTKQKAKTDLYTHSFFFTTNPYYTTCYYCQQIVK